MKQFLSLFSCLAIIWGAQQIAANDIQELVVGGQNTSISEIPYQAALLSNNKIVCGGVILAPYFILTSARCVNENVDSVRLGSSFYAEGGVVTKITTIYPHPRFSLATYDFDIAVVTLPAPLNYTKDIQPVKLSNVELPNDAIFRTSGWGLAGTRSPYLQSAIVPMVSHDKCRRIYNGSPVITQRMLCAGEKGKSACNFDYGSPLTYNGELAGMVSFGRECGSPDIPWVYTNTGERFIRRFIDQFAPED